MLKLDDTFARGKTQLPCENTVLHSSDNRVIEGKPVMGNAKRVCHEWLCPMKTIEFPDTKRVL